MAEFNMNNPPAGTVTRGERYITWKIPREYVTDTLELPYGRRRKGDGVTAEVISDKIVDQGRWETYHELLFRVPGQAENEAWSLGYTIGSTEMQDGTDLFDGVDEVECVLHELAPRLVATWEPIDPSRTAAPDEISVIRAAVRMLEKRSAISTYDTGQIEQCLENVRRLEALHAHVAKECAEYEGGANAV